jgi:hypothetical protein
LNDFHFKYNPLGVKVEILGPLFFFIGRPCRSKSKSSL